MRFLRPLLVSILLCASSGAADASATFSGPTQFAAGDFPVAVVSADLTGDSKLDLIAVNRISDDAYVYVGDGHGGFVFLQSFAVGNFPQGVAAADFDADTMTDLATTAVPFNSGTVSAWIGNGDGTFQFPESLTADDGTRSVLAVDIDDDGPTDLVVTNSTRGNISIFLGNGDGTFGAEIRVSVGTASSFPTDLAIADFDEDGNLDVVTSNAQSTDHSLGLVLGNGDGSFGTPTAFPTTCQRPESVVAGMFDADAHVDLAIACFASSDVAVMLGDGNGGFAAPQVYDLLPDGADPYWILSGDFDNDGLPDLVTSNNGSFSLLNGNGDGTFASPVTQAALPGSFLGADAADYNEDGWLDLAFANNNQDEIWVYLNTTGCVANGCTPRLELDAAGDLSWSGVPGAVGYDVIRGDLPLLRGADGDFAVATEVCLASLHATPSLTIAGSPTTGEGWWFLVRAVTAAGAGSYDAAAGSLAGPRDPGIAASGSDCP